MKILLLSEVGIQLWEHPPSTPNPIFSTLTLAGENANAILPPVREELHQLTARFPVLFSWFTQGHLTTGDSLLRRKLLETRVSSKNGFATILITECEGVLCTIGAPMPPIESQHLDALGDYRRCLLYWSADKITSPTQVADLMSPCKFGVEPVGLTSVLVASKTALIGRCYQDNDIHTAFQWIGLSESIQTVRRSLSSLEILEVASRNDVVRELRDSNLTRQP